MCLVFCTRAGKNTISQYLVSDRFVLEAWLVQEGFNLILVKV